MTITIQFFGDNLYETIANLCLANDLGFKLVRKNGQFAFSLYAGVDRSYEQTTNPYVVFSPNYDNLMDSNYYSSTATLKNVTLVGGEGEGSDRKTAVYATGTETGLDRRELFTDAASTSSTTSGGTMSASKYTKTLQAKGEENLADYTETESFEGQVDAFRMFTYGQDFKLGDVVQIENEFGLKARSRISEFIRSNNKDGMQAYPTFTLVE